MQYKLITHKSHWYKMAQKFCNDGVILYIIYFSINFRYDDLIKYIYSVLLKTNIFENLPRSFLLLFHYYYAAIFKSSLFHL
jgi:hypothetical protein